MKLYDYCCKDNFYMMTEAKFKKHKIPKREPDFISGSGSEYWYTEKGVIRLSGHWDCQIASCYWYLEGFEDGNRCGYCRFEDFKLRDFEVVVYVKNYEVFNCFEYTGCIEDRDIKYFLKKITWDMLCDKQVWFYGRSTQFLYNRDMSIKFDY